MGAKKNLLQLVIMGLESKSMKLLSILFALIMAVSLFLPWYVSEMSADGIVSANMSTYQNQMEVNVVQSNFNVSDLSSGITMDTATKFASSTTVKKSVSFLGVSILVLTIVGLILSLKNFKWSIVFGIINLLFAIIQIYGIYELSKYSLNVKTSGQAVSANSGYGLGAYLFLVSAVIFIIANIRLLGFNFKKNFINSTYSNVNNENQLTIAPNDSLTILKEFDNTNGSEIIKEERTGNKENMILRIVLGLIIVSIAGYFVINSTFKNQTPNSKTILHDTIFLQTKKISTTKINKTSKKNTSDIVINSNKEKRPTYFNDFLGGSYNGVFGDKIIEISIKSISDNGKVSGSENVDNIERALTGTVNMEDDVINFILKEPGTDEWDGVFTFKIENGVQGVLEGKWQSNNGKLTHDEYLVK